MTSITTGRRTTFAAVLAIPAILIALVGCSNGTSSSVGAESGNGTTAEADPLFAWELKFTQCLRDKGIDIKDPDPKTGVDQPPLTDEVRAAMKSCESEVGGPPVAKMTPEQEEETYQNSLKNAQCFRDNGFDVKDPGRGEGLQIPDVDVPDEVFQECLPIEDGK